MQDSDSKELHQLGKDMGKVLEVLGNLSEGQIRLEKRMDGLDHRMDYLEQDVSALKKGQERLEKRMDRMEQDVGILKEDVSVIKEAVIENTRWNGEQDKRILRLETHVGLPKLVISSD